MKIRSAYTNQELDFDVVEKLDPVTNQTMMLIKHDSLRDVIYNQLAITKKGSVDYNYVRADRDHAVVECIIDDGNGRVVKEIGEAVPETLENDIARSYPTLIASQRAFDRAAILLLMLAGKQLSNGEMGEFLPFDFEPAIIKPDEVNDNVIDDNGQDEPYMNAPILAEESLMNIPEGIDDVSDIAPDELVEEISPTVDHVDAPVDAPIEVPIDTTSNEDKIEELGAIVFAAGKYTNNPKTIAQIYQTDAEYLRKLLLIKTPAPSLAAAIVDVKAYLALVEQ